MELGNEIKARRKALGLTQDALAEKLYVTRQTVSNWENDKSYPDIHSLILLSTVFGVTLDQLVKGDIEKMKEQISPQAIRRFKRDNAAFFILLLAAIVSGVPLTSAFGAAGAILCAALCSAAMYFCARVEDAKKKNGIYTYREIIAFMKGERLDSIQKAREEGKRRYQQFMLALAAGLAAFAISSVLGVLFS